MRRTRCGAGSSIWSVSGTGPDDGEAKIFDLQQDDAQSQKKDRSFFWVVSVVLFFDFFVFAEGRWFFSFFEDRVKFYFSVSLFLSRMENTDF
jgi:hypothetical protein